MNKLFSSEEYQVDGFRKRSDQYWVMLLSLFTGARINELCQLLTKDIYKSDGVYVIDINDGDNKKVKTKSAVRIIPIHKTLIVLGFIEYLEVISKHNHTKLFPTLKPDKNRNCARHISRFFNEKYKKSSGFIIHCGIKKHTDKGVKVFHSFI